MTFSERNLQELRTQYVNVDWKCLSLTAAYAELPLLNPRAREFAAQGFARRILLMARCIHNVFGALPPENKDVPPQARVQDATINIQAFTINVFGCLDNLAWVWVHEKDLKQRNGKSINKRDVGLGPNSTRVRESFSAEFREYLQCLDDWFDGIGEFRDALAHRIGLYIPPYAISPSNLEAFNDLTREIAEAQTRLDVREHTRLVREAEKLGVFTPLMQHSFEESRGPIYFHGQMLVDLVTVEEIAKRLLREF